MRADGARTAHVASLNRGGTPRLSSGGDQGNIGLRVFVDHLDPPIWSDATTLTVPADLSGATGPSEMSHNRWRVTLPMRCRGR